MKNKLTLKEVFTAGAMAAVASSVINAILFFVFHSAGIISDDIFIQPNQPMTIAPIIISSIMPTLIACLVFFLLDKYTQNGFKLFKIVSIVLLILTFGNPFFGIPNITVAYAIALNVMHVVVAGFVLYFIGKKVAAVNTSTH